MVGEHRLISSRHRLLETAQPRLHMGHRDMGLACRQRPGRGGVGVPITITRSGFSPEEHFLNPLEHLAGLVAVGARSPTPR